MITKLSSGNYDVISSGYSFFYTDEFRIDLYSDNGKKDISVIIELISNDNIKKATIDAKVDDDNNGMIITCTNILNHDNKNGIIRPVNIAEDEDGKKMYLMFYIQREGSPGCMRTNSIKYTIFKER